MPTHSGNSIAEQPQFDPAMKSLVEPRSRAPRLVLQPDCTTCGCLTDERGYSVLQVALDHTAQTGHVVVLNGTIDLPEDQQATDAEQFASIESSVVIAYTDGGARGNPGPSGYGVVIQDGTGAKLAEFSEYLGHQTNNYAEYRGVIAALEYAIEHGFPNLEVRSDSELVVNQIRGTYRVKNHELRELHAQATELIKKLGSFEIAHIRREQNTRADRLANHAMDRGTTKPS